MSASSGGSAGQSCHTLTSVPAAGQGTRRIMTGTSFPYTDLLLHDLGEGWRTTGRRVRPMARVAHRAAVGIS